MTAPLYALVRSCLPPVIAEDPHRLAVDAVSLGLPPGVWPDLIATDLGNGRAFLLLALSPGGALYRQPGGPLHLRLFRD